MASPLIQLSELDTLHAFVGPIFFVQNKAKKKIKWNELIECLLALYALSPDGNFSGAKRMIQPFETIIYHYACSIHVCQERAISEQVSIGGGGCIAHRCHFSYILSIITTTPSIHYIILAFSIFSVNK